MNISRLKSYSVVAAVVFLWLLIVVLIDITRRYIGGAKTLLISSTFLFWVFDYYLKYLNRLPTETVGADLCFGSITIYASCLISIIASQPSLLGQDVPTIVLLGVYNFVAWAMSLNLVHLASEGDEARPFTLLMRHMSPREAIRTATGLGVATYFMQAFYMAQVL